ncbi:lytic transglycosylase domain-containing protein [Nesterenkonia alkaliphila]|uniref:lytic transglycosylase domain-containing protein n=1 Tax=Nesterenkonia alkaliphila TaxID=1463631 RepID=UPI001E3410D0|nr:lytic murein transglycosylase [Nesterenkonia alkaliphila]
MSQSSARHRRRRIYPVLGAGAAAGVFIILLRSCGAESEPEPPHPTELGFPAAPQQEHPVVNEEAAGPGEVPITELVDPEWVSATADRTGIPERAVQSYGGAAAHLAQTDPDCGLGWNTLAGIGEVESHHGSYGGSSIGEDGVVQPPIIGVPLDGSEGLMEIPDTDGGELDGDEEWDRAVGPMQFIPTTWEQYAQDGNLDGETDVHQYDDAALAAAHYLCTHGEDLSTDRGWNDAVAAYNQSAEYARDVAGHAERYLSDE